ncbi:hypothetical protein [Flavobacterium sp. H122]|uniref:hypothetical protein n=1 Tax=Flavobacterium sp. H122 TaxID=2529860 RepID=UPI0010AA9A5B|nr:hypothetical protein [Flavobacterium sp. H122]
MKIKFIILYTACFFVSSIIDVKSNVSKNEEINSLSKNINSPSIVNQENADSKYGKTKFELVEVKQISNNKYQDSIVSRLKSLRVEIDEKNIYINNISAKYSSDKSDSKRFFRRNYVYNYYTDYLYKNYNVDVKKEVNYLEISYEDAQKYPFKDFFLEGGVTVFMNDYLLLQYSDYIITFKKSSNKFSEKEISTAEILINKSSLRQKGFYVHDSCFVKNENTTFKIIAIEKIVNKNNKGNWYFGLPIIILKNNEKRELYRNDNLVFKFYDNCPADGYGRLVAKGNYFTIEQISCVDFLFVRSYITFKIGNDNSVFIHKYSEEYTDRSDPNKVIPTKFWTVNDFGKLNFEDVSEKFLMKLRQTKPKI